MGKSSSHERRKLKEQGHWSVERIFVLPDADEPVTARQVRHLVSSGDLDPQAEVRVLGKWTVINAQRVIDVLQKEPGAAVPYESLLRPLEPVIPRRAGNQSDGFPNPVERAASSPPIEERRPSWDWRESLLVKAVTLIWGSYSGWAHRTKKRWVVTLTLGGLYVSLAFPVTMFLGNHPQMDLSTLLNGVLIGITTPFFLAMQFAIVYPFGKLADLWRNKWWEAGWLLVAIVLVLGVSTTIWAAGIRTLRTQLLVPVPVLMKSCMAEEVQVGSSRRGAVCADGWRSRATGSGACSHHGGVAYWTYETRRRSAEECKAWAEKVSWR